MTILFMEWNSFGNEDIIENLETMGHEVRHIPFTDDTMKQEQIEKLLSEKLKRVPVILCFLLLLSGGFENMQTAGFELCFLGL